MEILGLVWVVGLGAFTLALLVRHAMRMPDDD